MGKFSSYNDTTGGGSTIDTPDTSTCQDCGKDTHKPGQGQLRAIMRDKRGNAREYAPSEVMEWKVTARDNGMPKTDWRSLGVYRGNLTFIKWEMLCNDCKYDPNRTTAEQRSDLREAMDTSDITPKTTQKAYKIIRQLLAPGLMGTCKANDQQKQYAAKVVLWHWPQASNEPMPADIEKLCKGLVVA